MAGRFVVLPHHYHLQIDFETLRAESAVKTDSYQGTVKTDSYQGTVKTDSYQGTASAVPYFP